MVEAFWAPVRNIEPASQMQNRKYDSEAETTPDRLPTLSISIEKVCFVVVKAREFDVKDVATIPDDGSNPTDDCVVGVLEDRGYRAVPPQDATAAGTDLEDALAAFGRSCEEFPFSHPAIAAAEPHQGDEIDKRRGSDEDYTPDFHAAERQPEYFSPGPTST